MTPRWTNTQIETLVRDNATYHDDDDGWTLYNWVYGLSANTAEELLQQLRDDYETQLQTLRKRIYNNEN